MRKSRGSLLAGAILLVLTLSSCGGSGETNSGASGQSGPTDVTLTAFRASFVNYPVYVAEAQGLFEKHGLNVEITYAEGDDVTNALITGATDFAAPATEHLVEMQTKGHEIQSIVQNQSAPPFTVIVKNDVETPNADQTYPAMLKDLEGLTLGVSSLGASTDKTLRYLLEDAGLDPESDVEIIAVGEPSTQLAALQQGSIDGTIAFEPIQSQAVLGLKIAKPILDIQGGEGPAIFSEYAYNGVAAQSEYIDENPETVKRMRDAIWEATDFIADPANAERATAIAVKYMGMEEPVMEAFLEKYRGIFTPHVSNTGLANVNKFMMESGATDEPVPYDEVVSTRYMPPGLPFPGQG